MKAFGKAKIIQQKKTKSERKLNNSNSHALLEVIPTVWEEYKKEVGEDLFDYVEILVPGQILKSMSKRLKGMKVGDIVYVLCEIQGYSGPQAYGSDLYDVYLA